MLNSIKKAPGLIWLCKDCLQPGKEILNSEKDKENEEMSSKLEKIEKSLACNQKSAQTLQKSLEKDMNERFAKLEENLVNKLDAIIQKQEQIPAALKTAWPKTPSNATSDLKEIMRETLIQQEKAKEEVEKRELNIIMYNVPESKKTIAAERETDDEQFFKNFCGEGLKMESVPRLQKAIRLGKVKPTSDNESHPEMRKHRPLKIILDSKEDKLSLFKSLKHLREAEPTFKCVSVAHDYSREMRDKMRQMLSKAKEEDGENANQFSYSIKGVGVDIKVLKRKKNTRGLDQNAD